MFLRSILFFNKIQHVFANSANDVSIVEISTNRNLDDRKQCKRVLFEENPMLILETYNLHEAESIAKIIYEVFLDKLKFPIHVKLDYTTKDTRSEYKILKKDLRFSSYWYYLNNNSFTLLYNGKEKIIYEILSSFAQKTSKLYDFILCCHFNVKKINYFELKEVIYILMTVKMRNRPSYKVEQVFDNEDYKNLLNNIGDIFKSDVTNFGIEEDKVKKTQTDLNEIPQRRMNLRPFLFNPSLLFNPLHLLVGRI
ncbi:uncharacterized protein VNE69_08112 [Vairimorpha necatrix]|uniref:Uncharacterized protein n=1 Tax=Vairimorpha necatrix TaxID=6039 RepID=A0AAX4JF00_9MICR